MEYIFFRCHNRKPVMLSFENHIMFSMVIHGFFFQKQQGSDCCLKSDFFVLKLLTERSKIYFLNLVT